MLSSIAKKEGFYFGETLTGFKWIGNEAINLEKNQGYDVLFAYEEAIGFMIGDIVRDKDGVTALAVFAELTVQLKKRGTTVSEYLDELYRRYGYFMGKNSYYVCHSPTTINKIFDKIRYDETSAKQTTDSKYPLSYPTTLANYKVIYTRDLTIGYDSSQPDNKPIFPISKSSQMITFGLENGGTEPKIKYYFELSGDDKDQVEMELSRIVKTVIDELLEPEKYVKLSGFILKSSACGWTLHRVEIVLLSVLV
ncbi:13664_t:CDS:2 [Entrophospora sp. SA101]|nr:13664_t:CDS:2 [Entrophospora sp. SA101]